MPLEPAKQIQQHAHWALKSELLPQILGDYEFMMEVGPTC